MTLPSLKQPHFLLLLSMLVAFSWLGYVTQVNQFNPISLNEILIWLQKRDWATPPDLASSVFWYITLPTSIMAIIIGAMLACSGVLIQVSLNNDFASPSTLGIGSGALLGSLLVQMLLPEPSLISIWGGSFFVALMVSILVSLLSSFIGGGRLNIVLIGMAMSIGVGALASALMIFHEQKFDGMFLWGSGQIEQTDHQLLQLTLIPSVLLLAICIGLAHKLALFTLGSDLARHLGMNVKIWRGLFLLLAVALASLATSVAGLIGFVGLMAPHLARFLGARQLPYLMTMAALIGALLVLLADGFSALWMGAGYRLPTGVLTVLLGAPFLIWLLLASRSRFQAASENKRFGIEPIIKLTPLTIISACLLLAIVSIGFWLPSAEDMGARFAIWRVAISFCVGAALAMSGCVLQTLLRNPMASPDISGISSTSVLFVALGILFFPSLSYWQLVALSMLGAATVLFILLGVIRLNLSIAQLALFGVAIAAFSSTVTTVLLAMGSSHGGSTLLWLSGTTYGTGKWQVSFIAGTSLLVMLCFLALSRRLDSLMLGAPLPQLQGLKPKRLILLSMLLTALLTAAAVAVAGSIGFIGLLAPHMVRLFGAIKHACLIPASALFGGALMVWADGLGRSLIAPAEIPAGIMISCLGSLYFILLVIVGYRLQRR